MKAVVSIVAFCLLVPTLATPQEQGFQDPLLDRLAGDWVLTGTIAGAETTHDIVAEWVLGHQYLRFHELARETDSSGAPEYEAIVFIGGDQPTNGYACLWLDMTGGSGLSSEVIGRAKPSADELAFVFDMGDESFIHTTFAYGRDNDTWHWLIDMENGGKRTSFARVSLTRR